MGYVYAFWEDSWIPDIELINISIKLDIIIPSYRDNET